MRRLTISVIAMLIFGAASPAFAAKEKRVVTLKGRGGTVTAAVTQTKVITKVVAASGGGGAGAGSNCKVTQGAGQLGGGDQLHADGSVWVLGTRVCEGGAVDVAVFCFANCPTNPATGQIIIRLPTADDARALLPKILPIARLSPPLEKVEVSNLGGYLIGMPAYFGVDADNWNTSLQATATEGPYSMTVIAKPVKLEVRVNGQLVKTCTGTEPIDYVSENWRTTSNSCKHLFTDRADGSAKVSLQIIYAHTYASIPPGSPAPNGELGASQTNEFDIPLTEVQPVIKSIT